MSSVVGHKPPPIFKRGPRPIVRLLAYVTLSLFMLVADLRYEYLTLLREAFAVMTYPVKMAAASPADFMRNATHYFGSLVEVQEDNAALRRAQLETAKRLLRQEVLEEENRQLRGLLDMREALRMKSIATEVLYSSRDPFSRRVILNKGSLQEIEPGLAVVDEIGVLGQVVHVDPVQSEVMLITDKDLSVPVKTTRSGVRGVLFGAGEGRLEMRFVLADADVKPGDRLVTSGLDGVYVPGLPVAEVLEVRRGEQAFANILASPLAGVEKAQHVLVIGRLHLPDTPNPYSQTTKPKEDRAVLRVGPASKKPVLRSKRKE